MGMRLAARRVGSTPRVFARLIVDAGVAYRSPEFAAGGVVVLNATQQAQIAEGGVLSVANGAEFTEDVLMFK